MAVQLVDPHEIIRGCQSCSGEVTEYRGSEELAQFVPLRGSKECSYSDRRTTISLLGLSIKGRTLERPKRKRWAIGPMR